MRRALLDMRPDRFEDIIALVALYRPGPMANIPTYCARKHDMEKPDYIHPKLESDPEGDLRRHRLSGTGDAGRADPGRLHARPGRSPAPRHGQEDQKGDAGAARDFVEGAVKNGIERHQADAIFDLLERFAEYGFNKSHAAAYALVAYQTAYMKANFPVEFLAASMTLDMGNTDKLAEFRAEAERLGIKVDPPSINRSHVAFEVDGNTIIYALAALKGVGKQAVEAIVAARDNGKFADLADFADRINPRAVNKRVLESLAAAGAFDEFEPNRARVFPAMDAVLGARPARARSASVGQNELFGGGGQREPIALPNAEPWLPAERLKARIRGGRIFPLRPSARRLRRRAQETARAVLGRFLARGEGRRDRRPRRRHRGVAAGAAHPHGQQDGHHRPVRSDRPLRGGDFLGRARPSIAICSSRAPPCCLFLSAEVQGDEVRARIQSAEPLDAAAANLTKACASSCATRRRSRRWPSGWSRRAAARPMATAR